MRYRSRRHARRVVALAMNLFVASSASVAAAEPQIPRLDLKATLEIVARRMGIALRPEIPLPAIRLEGTTPLRQFQDAVEAQWESRPARFSSVYVVATNEIYLIDSPRYYLAMRRTIHDSLAHELVHYVQAHYFKADLASDWQELEAVAIQNWFRAEHVQTRIADAVR